SPRRDLQRQRRTSVIVHGPEIGAYRHRHRNTVALVPGRAGGVAIGDAGQVIADHLLVVLKAATSQHHTSARFDADGFAPSLGPHPEDFLGYLMLDQLPARRLVEDRDRALFDQAFEPLPGEGITVGRAIVEFMHAAGAWQVGEFDADRRMLMLLRVAAEALEPMIVAAHLL